MGTIGFEPISADLEPNRINQIIIDSHGVLYIGYIYLNSCRF